MRRKNKKKGGKDVKKQDSLTKDGDGSSKTTVKYADTVDENMTVYFNQVKEPKKILKDSPTAKKKVNKKKKDETIGTVVFEDPKDDNLSTYHVIS